MALVSALNRLRRPEDRTVVALVAPALSLTGGCCSFQSALTGARAPDESTGVGDVAADSLTAATLDCHARCCTAEAMSPAWLCSTDEETLISPAVNRLRNGRPNRPAQKP